jgi:AraC family transcriptional activator of pobA
LFHQHAVGEAIRSGQLDGALRARVIGRAESLSGPSWLVALVEAGSVGLAGGDDLIAGPTLVWRPWGTEEFARFAPGAMGWYVMLGSSTLAGAIGHLPEARDLRDFVDVPITVELHDRTPELERLRAAFQGLHTELGADAQSARAVVDAYLRIILINLYRARLSKLAFHDTAPPSYHAFARFSDLVETHFRDRWTVSDYAERLGMTRDRLQDICRRARGKAPKELIDRRVAREARLQLESSSLSIQRIAALLGFTSTPQFNRFFLRMSGITPGRYRRLSEDRRTTSDATAADLYEWP